MQRRRSLVRQSPAIAVAIVALLFALGSGAYAAGFASGRTGVTAVAVSARGAEPASSPSSGIQWHKLRLFNGWTALDAGDYRTPSYGVKDGVLYLSGILAAPRHGEQPQVGRLPEGARPPSYLWLSFMNFGADNLGEMEIEPDGDVFVYSLASSGPLVDPSLDGISFPLNS
ncbi:MAG TPA: hypothetical protein VMR14_17095 [Streptosporangiaceae bacterium]|nr:hypothetical protein [Streptosporangiaceae bacterium]